MKYRYIFAVGIGLILSISIPFGVSYLNYSTAKAQSVVCNTWTQVNENAFGMGQGPEGSYSGGIFNGYYGEEGFEVATFNNQLYLGMEADNVFGARLWRTKAGVIGPNSQNDWEEVIADANGYPFSLPNPVQADHIDSLESFQGFLYASIANRSGSPLGTRIFRSPTGNPGSWMDAVITQSSPDGSKITDIANENFKDMQVFSDQLCGGTWNAVKGAQVWCTPDGTNWAQKNQSGFGRVNNAVIWSGLVFKNSLYWGVQDFNGSPSDSSNDIARLFRTNDINGTPVWTPVFTGTVGSLRVDLLGDLAGYIYISHKSPDGIIILRSSSGDPGSWTQVNMPGMAVGNVNNTVPIVDGAVVFDNELYVAVSNMVSGVEVWKTSASVVDDGRDWLQIGLGGLGDSNNFTAELTDFNGQLYAWTSNYLVGQEVLRLDCTGEPPVSTPKFITVSSKPGFCSSLHDAIQAANLGISINNCVGSAGLDIINLAEPIQITSSLPAITSPITLDGAGFSIQNTSPISFSLFYVNPTGYLIVDQTEFNGFRGINGSVINNQGRAEFNNSSIINNHSSGLGGAIFNSGLLRLNQSNLSGNSALEGGAVANLGELYILSSSISYNSAANRGGGIDNIAGMVAVKTSLLASNQALLGSECSGNLSSQDYNFIQSTANCAISGSISHNINNLDPMLSSLQQTNRPQFSLHYQALLPGSPAIDAVPKELCPSKDIRSFSHAIDYPGLGTNAFCDIGVFELQNPETGRAVIFANTINFSNTQVSITDNSLMGAPASSHPGLTTVTRLAVSPGNIPGSGGVLPFQIKLTSVNNINLDINLTICFSPWELSNPILLQSEQAIIMDKNDITGFQSVESSSALDEGSLSLYYYDGTQKTWNYVGSDSNINHCLTKNHVTHTGVWVVASVQPTRIILQSLKMTLKNNDYPFLVVILLSLLYLLGWSWLNKKK